MEQAAPIRAVSLERRFALWRKYGNPCVRVDRGGGGPCGVQVHVSGIIPPCSEHHIWAKGKTLEDALASVMKKLESSLMAEDAAVYFAGLDVLDEGAD